jgi:hypothetical protein
MDLYGIGMALVWLIAGLTISLAVAYILCHFIFWENEDK